MTISLKPPDSNPNFWDGYRAVETPGNHPDCPYIVHGPKKTWTLFRNQIRHHFLFPVPTDVVTGQIKIKSVTWFKETILENGDVMLETCLD